MIVSRFICNLSRHHAQIANYGLCSSRNFLKCVPFPSSSPDLVNSCQRRRLHERAKEFRYIKDTDRFGKQVYSGPANKLVKNVKAFSIGTSMIALAVQPAVFASLMPTLPVSGSSLAAIIASTALASMIFVTPLLLHILTKKYVIRMFYQPDSRTFTLTRYSLLMCETALEFTPEEVTVSEGPFSHVNIGNQAFAISPKCFTDLEAYKVLMGYDKEFDWSTFLAKNDESDPDEDDSDKSDVVQKQ